MSAAATSAPPKLDTSEEHYDAPSLVQRLQERANEKLRVKAKEFEERQKLEERKNKRRIFKNRFKLKKDSHEAREKAERLSRKERKRAKLEMQRL